MGLSRDAKARGLRKRADEITGKLGQAFYRPSFAQAPASGLGPARYSTNRATLRVYRGEKAWAQEYPGREFASLQVVQLYVDHVLSLPWPWSGARGAVLVRPSPNHRQASYRIGQLLIPDNPNGRREPVVLHELAHHLAAIPHQHGGEFQAAMRALVGTMMGIPAQTALIRHYNGGTGGLDT